MNAIPNDRSDRRGLRGLRVRHRLESFFQMKSRGTTVGRELIAGATTFAAMSYIIVVNPLILSSTGMSRPGLLLATVLSAVIGTLIMALWANLPIAMAPGMGTNIVFAQVLVAQMGISWQAGLAMVFLNGVIFAALSLTRWRQVIVASFPEPIKLGMQCSIGIFVGYLGLKNGGLIIAEANGAIAFANLTDPTVLLATAGIVLTPLLVVMRVPGALLISIFAITLAGHFIQDAHGVYLTATPTDWFAVPSLDSDVFMALDFRQFFRQFLTLLPVTLYFLLSEFFSGTSTLVGVSRRAGLMNADGQIPRARAAFTSDAMASVIGAVAGTSTVTAYVESVAGIEAGGRTGLVGVAVAALFALSLFFAPLIAVVPLLATAPALVLVGILMLEGLADIDPSRPDCTLPPLFMVIVTACTGDLMVGLALGALVYTLVLVALRDWARIRPMLLLLDAVLGIYLVLRGYVMH